jgi:hypothetical protein
MDARPDREPVARRRFRHAATGHEATLVVERGGVHGGARELLWKVWIEEAQGSPPAVAKLRYLSAHDSRNAARREFAERQRALRRIGYERVG